MRVTSRYCEQCGIKIPLEDIRRGKFLEHEGDFYCMQCRDDVLPRINKSQKNSPPKGTPSAPVKTSKRKISAYTNASESSIFGTKSPLTSPQGEAAASQNQLMLYGIIAGLLALMLIALIWILASSNQGPSVKKPLKGGEKKDPLQGQPLEKKVLEEIGEVDSHPSHPSQKVAKLTKIREKYSEFLSTQKGSKIRGKLDDKLQENRFLAAEKTAADSHALADKMELWKRTIEKLKGTPWEKKARENLEKLKKTFNQQAQMEYEKLVLDAKRAEDREEFEEARAILNRYSLEFRNTEFWIRHIDRIKEHLKKMISLQEKMNNLEIEATQEMDNGNFDEAFKKYRDFIDQCPVEKWKKKVEKLLEDAKLRHEKSKLKNEEEEKKKLAEQKRREQLKEKMARLRKSLQGGSWVTVFDGTDLSLWKEMGDWKIQSGYLIGEPTNNRSAMFLLAPFKNYSAEFSVQIKKGYFGMIVRFATDGRSNYVPFGEATNDQGAYPVATNQWVRFSVSVKEDYATVSCNSPNFKPMKLKVSVPPPGFLGFFVPPDSKVMFQSIKVKAE